MKNIYVFILICLFTTTGLKGQVKFVNEFLNIGVGARAHGMFGSVVANVNDATAAYWNPSALTEINAPLSLAAMHANWFGDVANYDYFTIAKRMSSGNAFGALSFIRMGVDNIPNTLNIVNPDGTIDFEKIEEFNAADYAFLVSYAKKTNDKFSLGGNVKVIRRKIGSFGGAWGFGGDLSMTYKLKNLRFGLMARDITTTFNAWSFTLSEEEKAVFLNTGNDVPLSSTEISLPRFILATCLTGTIDSSFSYLVELDANLSTNGTKAGILSSDKFSIDPSLGAEFGYKGRVFIRFGVGNIQRLLNEVNSDKRVFDIQPNVGLGISLGRLKIDYALGNVGNISGVLASHIFSFNLNLAERRKNELKTNL